MSIKQKFDAEMYKIYQRAKEEINYTASAFLQMLDKHRGVETAKRLINASSPSDGYTKLWEKGRLDLTVEALIVENSEWHELFLPKEIERARKRLRDYDYKQQP